MIKNSAILIFSVLLLIAVVVNANFIDYRGLIPNISPETFETTVSLHSQFPNSVTIFHKGRPVLWEATGVKDFHLSDGELDGILQNGIAYLYNNACGGIVAPPNAEAVFVHGDRLIISTPDRHHIYGISDCAEYNRIWRFGDMLAYSSGSGLLCEASPLERTVRTALTGTILYRDSTLSQTIAVYGDQNGCYFMQRNGTIDMYSAKNRAMQAFAYIDDLVLSATPHDNGFAGFSSSGFFRAYINGNTGVYVEYDRIPAGYCTDAANSLEPICEVDFSSALAMDLVISHKRAVTFDNLYVLSGDRMRAYGRDTVWMRQLVTTYSLPTPCLYENNVYFNNLFGDILRVNIYDNRMAFPAEAYPQYCNSGAVSYRDGKLVMQNGKVVYTFAEFIRQESGRVMYKRTESPDRVLYFVYQTR